MMFGGEIRPWGLREALEVARALSYVVELKTNEAGHVAGIGHETRPQLKQPEVYSRPFADPDELGRWLIEWMRRREGNR